MPNYKLLIFDLDGTLQDSMATVVADINRSLVRFGREPVNDTAAKAFVHLMTRDWFAHLVGDNEALIDQLMGYHSQLVLQRPPDAFSLFEGVRETLSHLQNLGLPLAIATAKGAEKAELDLHAHQLRQFFNQVMGGDSVIRSKPHPDMLHTILEQTGAEATETLYIGDAATDIEMGLAAGVWTCGVSYGVHGEERLRAAGAHHIVHTFPDLLTLLP